MLVLHVHGLRRHPALVWLDGQGALRAVDGRGEVVIDGRRVAADATDGIVLALDGEDIRRSRALVLMPLQAGDAQLATEAAWQHPAAEVGEVRGGAWQRYEGLPVEREGRETRVRVTADAVYSPVLVCEAEEAPRWRQALERAMNDPAPLP